MAVQEGAPIAFGVLLALSVLTGVVAEYKYTAESQGLAIAYQCRVELLRVARRKWSKRGTMTVVPFAPFVILTL